MMAVLTEFLGLLGGGIVSLGESIGSGVSNFVTDLFLTTGTDGAIEGLSTFGGVVAIFGGIALAISLTTLIFNWVRSIGN